MGFAQNKHGPCNCDGFGTIIVTNFSVATDVYIMLHQHVSTECHYVWWSSPWLFTLFWGNGGSTDQMFDFIWHKGDPLIQWFQWFQWTFCGFFELHFFCWGFLPSVFARRPRARKPTPRFWFYTYCCQMAWLPEDGEVRERWKPRRFPPWLLWWMRGKADLIRCYNIL